jgi:hypothetical protein
MRENLVENAKVPQNSLTGALEQDSSSDRLEFLSAFQ